MAGLLDIIGQLDPEQLRRLADAASQTTQIKPELPSWAPNPEQLQKNIDMLKGATPPMVQQPVYDQNGFRFESVPEQMTPWYDQSGLRYVYPSQMQEHPLQKLLRGY